MMQDATPNSANPRNDTWRGPIRSAAWPPSTMQAAETTKYALTAHSTPAGPRERSVRMSGKADIIAVLLAPTPSIARHDDHRTEANTARCFNVAPPLPVALGRRASHAALTRVRVFRLNRTRATNRY